MNQPQIESTIRAFLVESFLSPDRARTLTRTDDLFKILDSLQVLRLVLQLEALFGVKVADGDLTPENLGTLERVANYVQQNQSHTQLATL